MKKDEIIVKAIQWWECKRPCAWTFTQHCDDPKVNCMTTAEQELAVTISMYIRKKK